MYFIYNLHYFFLRQMSFLSNMDTLIKYYLFLSQFSNCFLLLWSNSSQNIFWAVRFSFVYGIQLMPTLTFDAVFLFMLSIYRHHYCWYYLMWFVQQDFHGLQIWALLLLFALDSLLYFFFLMQKSIHASQECNFLQ